MATTQDAPTELVQHVPLGHPLRRPYVVDDQGTLVFLAQEGGFPWIMTSMLPADMGPTEDPNDFLPPTIDEAGLDALTLAVYKARSSVSPYKRNRTVKEKIIPRLLVEEGKEFKANTLNTRDQVLRNELGIFAEGFHITKLVKGVKMVPAQVAESAKKHSPLQWLHRTWGAIELGNFTYQCAGTIYQLRAPQDLPPQIVELLKELNLPVPKVRDYLEARHDVWKFFFPRHYQDTNQLRKTNPSVFPPLPGYVLTEGDFAQHFLPQEQNGEKEQGELHLDDNEEVEEEQDWYVNEDNATGDVVTSEVPMFGNDASSSMAMEPWWGAHLANLDHTNTCPFGDTSCDLCKNIYMDIDFAGNLDHTLNGCSGLNCTYCKMEQRGSEFVRSVLQKDREAKVYHIMECPEITTGCPLCEKYLAENLFEGAPPLCDCQGADCKDCNLQQETAIMVSEIVDRSSAQDSTVTDPTSDAMFD